ncbi:hypothetical protein LOK49_LG04G02161 [Camellia lanceoleosa]|uniref:Uncharacterized protein n=1 Tax=Camellia lanceoleosa TaxID=1840588 RepID=A0ACC0HWS2_9ERIC|nr:hypothetical protein LOK49_LG04G02161 [Camellia lanceoleosa]
MAVSGRQSARSRIKLHTDANEDRTTLRNPKLRKPRSKDHSLIRLLNVDLKVLLGFGIITFKVNTRRACIGELITLTFILEFMRCIPLPFVKFYLHFF